MPKPPKAIKSYKHKAVKRAHLPSSEEAGYEEANTAVKEGPEVAEFPRNPVVHRGQDPELFWMNKYGTDDRQDTTHVDIRSLYRHEHIAPEQIIKGLYKIVQTDTNQDDLFFKTNDLFGNALEREELEKVGDYYKHSDGWTNRLIQGDSLLVMSSLLEREGMAGQVQCIYIDPPYGIKYGSNWQVKLNNRTVTDGKDEDLSGEPEIIKAFRDTWELGIHSYLSYLRDRLVVARELLHESGSCFVQISDENVHLVRSLMDEVFGSGNFCSMITFQKTSSSTTRTLPRTSDYLIWYAKDLDSVKIRKLYLEQKPGAEGAKEYKRVELKSGEILPISKFIEKNELKLPEDAKIFSTGDISSDGGDDPDIEVEWEGKKIVLSCKPNRHWKVGVEGTKVLWEKGRLLRQKGLRIYKRYFSDFPYRELSHVWSDSRGESDAAYVVQTSDLVVQRCLLLTTDPGDLVLDPTCGSGTTAFVAEQFARRWVSIDTSRIALNVAKIRLTTSSLPYYKLHDSEGCDVRQGFIYDTAKRITPSSIAHEEAAETITLYDRPEEDKKRLRVAGPFTVETLQNYEPVTPEDLARQRDDDAELAGFEDLIFEHLKTAGIKTGDKTENAVFARVDRLASANLHAEGYYPTAQGERKGYLYIGPKFGTVSKRAVNEAVKECRHRGDAQWLIILGFSFESGIQEATRDQGLFTVSIVRMHDDLMQEGLLKKDKKAASFVTIGEPDIRLHKEKGDRIAVEIAGLDIYDPIKDVVKSRDVHDIAYWMVDDDYDGSNFVVKQVYFCGGDKDEYDKWKKGLESVASLSTKKKAEQTLKIEIDEEAWSSLYSHKSRPFKHKPGQKIAVRVISQFGEETTKVIS